MTIALTCRMIEDSLLSVTDPVSRWIPDFPRGDSMTVSHLLNHRAGVPHRVTTAGEESQPVTAADMVEKIRKAEFLFPPGEKSVYSSATYSLLARILELAGGAPFPELLRTRVFEPAGMTRAFDGDHRALLAGRARSYLSSPGGPINAPLQDLSFLVGAGSVYATPRDILNLMTAVHDGTLGALAKSALERGTGFRWNGITNGFRAFGDEHPESGWTVIYTGNRHLGSADLIRDALPKFLAGEDVPPPAMPGFTAVSLPVGHLERYEGTYEDERGSSITLTVEGTALYAGDWLIWQYQGQDWRWTRVSP